MAQNAWGKIQALTAQLNQYRDEYYNSDAQSVSDAVYDRMYDELATLEKETGIWMADSPTDPFDVKTGRPDGQADL